MDVDEDENNVKRGQDYGIEVDFEMLDNDEREVCGPEYSRECFVDCGTNQDGSPDALAEFDSSIAKVNTEIERMAPNMKAVDRYVFPGWTSQNMALTVFESLEDVEAKLVDTEKEADKARKDSKSARSQFDDVKRRRCSFRGGTGFCGGH